MTIPIIGQKEEPEIKIEDLVQGIQYLAMQNDQLRQFLSAAAKKADINSLTIGALCNLIVSKNLFTEKELEEVINTDVIKVYKAMEVNAKEEAEKRAAEYQKAIKENQELSENAIREAQNTFQKK